LADERGEELQHRELIKTFYLRPDFLNLLARFPMNLPVCESARVLKIQKRPEPPSQQGSDSRKSQKLNFKDTGKSNEHFLQ
jgi:hypothetical protein